MMSAYALLAEVSSPWRSALVTGSIDSTKRTHAVASGSVSGRLPVLVQPIVGYSRLRSAPRPLPRENSPPLARSPADQPSGLIAARYRWTFFNASLTGIDVESGSVPLYRRWLGSEVAHLARSSA
jgi:hypothetical protein